MCTRLIFSTQGAQANSDHLIGSLAITVAITALSESVRPARFLDKVLAIPRMGAPIFGLMGTPFTKYVQSC
ncbi:conserved hypothetical protein [Candidatus Methylobacter favarea]|uniref:Uncharacterized protein n=1 Tax=Candidatus Methylobacter favarea TaxID=2707345 RepID=A0A8S0XQB7_9GAMM|nr:conserved hypothetical protein [Candidatus Methylobacter favarea]